MPAAGARPVNTTGGTPTILNMPKATVLTNGLVEEVWQRQQAEGVPCGRCVEHDTGEVGVGRVPQDLDNLQVMYGQHQVSTIVGMSPPASLAVKHLCQPVDTSEPLFGSSNGLSTQLQQATEHMAD